MSQKHQDIADSLKTALAGLAKNHHWSSLLQANIYVGSYEKFLQCSILGAINQVSPKKAQFWCDMERRVKLGTTYLKPDLWLVDPSEAAWRRWKRACDDGTVDSACTDLARGIVEMKVAWTKGWANGSAVIGQRSKTIAKDALKLRGAAGGAWNRIPRFVLVCLAGVTEANSNPSTKDQKSKSKGQKSAMEDALTEASVVLNRTMMGIAKVKPTWELDLVPTASIGSGEFIGAKAILYDARWHNEVR